MIKEGRAHLRFCFVLNQIQWEQGRYFLHEHPKSASSWDQSSVKQLCSCEGISKYDSDMCCFGMHEMGKDGLEFVKKPTTFLTNAEEIRKLLGEQCEGMHKHIHLLNGRAKRAEIYPDELCLRILKGRMKQMERDGRIQECGVGCIMPEDEIDIGTIGE